MTRAILAGSLKMDGRFIKHDGRAVLYYAGANSLDLLEECEALARLFVASPDMLDALKDAVELYGKPGGPWNVPSEPGSWIEKARAAIDRAEGRTP